jgi:arylsulfatase A-like enzyme
VLALLLWASTALSLLSAHEIPHAWCNDDINACADTDTEEVNVTMLQLRHKLAGQPNILMIVADDLGFADIGFMTGARFSFTPHLDKLAEHGMRLMNHHVQPVCSPTRATLLTGRHVLRYGLQNTVISANDAYALPRNETLLSQNLKQAGYRTAIFGKWHLGFYKDWALPTARGFDEQYGYYLGKEDYWTHEYKGGLDWHRNDSRAETRDNGTYSAELLGAAAVDFVVRMKSREQPWFMYLAFQSVHYPLQAPEACIERYPNLTGQQRLRAAMVSCMDDAVGNLTQALILTHQMEDTIIVFISDNGAPYYRKLEGDDAVELAAEDNPLGEASWAGRSQCPRTPPHGGAGGSNYPLSGWKHWVFEGGVRSVAFVHARGLPHHSEHWGLFHSTDWLPTLVNLAGGSLAKNLPLDGFDIWEALKAGGSASPRSEIPVNIAACGPGYTSGFQSMMEGPQAAIIVGDLKLIVDCYWRETKELDTAQLYNITADISERHNVARSRPQDVKRLAARLAYWEALSVPPYADFAIEQSCGKGSALGNPAAWSPWCNEPKVVGDVA